MSAMKSFVNWLGLGPDDGEPYAGHLGAPHRATTGPEPPGSAAGDHYLAGVEPIAAPESAEPMVAKPALTPMTGDSVARPTVARPRSTSAAVRPVVVSPVVYDEAQQVGDHFKQSLPVIVNLQDAAGDVGRRMVDFASGLAYALDGTVERVTPGVYLLTPSDVLVARDDARPPDES